MEAPALQLDRFLSFTALAAPLDVVSSAAASISTQFQLSKPMLRTEEPLSLERMYVIAPPAGGAHPHNVVLYTPKYDTGSTVVITNRQDGWSSLSYALAKRLVARQVQILASQKGVEYPLVHFHAWFDGAERTVSCMRDSHAWVFHAQGARLPFEDVASYAAREVSKRLTREMAIGYVKALGWDAGASEFWQARGDAVYFDQAAVN